jgi:hypothetical protein
MLRVNSGLVNRTPSSLRWRASSAKQSKPTRPSTRASPGLGDKISGPAHDNWVAQRLLDATDTAA